MVTNGPLLIQEWMFFFFLAFQNGNIKNGKMEEASVKPGTGEVVPGSKGSSDVECMCLNTWLLSPNCENI